jgi:uncharacterized protein YdcH (DUF465 family)
VISFGVGGVRMDEIELKEILLKKNEEFRRLHEEHQSCEKKLESLRSKSFLTEDEKIEEREIKKLKLSLKDRMYLLMRQFPGEG